MLMTLEYLGEYRTYFHIGNSYGVSESACYRNIKWIEETLVRHPDFRLPGKKELIKSKDELEVILIDATETPIERPKKQKRYYSGKKKRHTLKSQIVVNKKTKEIVCTEFANGKKHDFRMFKESGIKIKKEIKVIVDTGYQGIKKLHEESDLPKKNSKKNKLSKEDKKRKSSK